MRMCTYIYRYINSYRYPHSYMSTCLHIYVYIYMLYARRATPPN